MSDGHIVDSAGRGDRVTAEMHALDRALAATEDMPAWASIPPGTRSLMLHEVLLAAYPVMQRALYDDLNKLAVIYSDVARTDNGDRDLIDAVLFLKALDAVLEDKYGLQLGDDRGPATAWTHLSLDDLRGYAERMSLLSGDATVIVVTGLSHSAEFIVAGGALRAHKDRILGALADSIRQRVRDA